MMASCSKQDFDRNTIMCPICLDVFIEPITLMCKHELCKQCYDEHFEKADFRCPMCQKRLSSWARKAVAKGSLVNKTKWKYIQENCSELIEKRLKGEDNYSTLQPNQIHVAKEGEVRSEYLEMKLKWDNEHKAQVDEEESASFQLIQQILKEEKDETERERRAQIERDKELAKVISEQLNQPVSPTTVGKKLLRSVTLPGKKGKITTPIRCKSIQTYCVKRSLCSEKENTVPDMLNETCDGILNNTKSHSSEQISNLSPKRCKYTDEEPSSSSY